MDRRWWYLSFADSSLPKGTQFLGAVLVPADGMADAIYQAHRRGINPGGSVLGGALPEDEEPPSGFVCRLLSREDCMEMDRVMSRQPG